MLAAIVVVGGIAAVLIALGVTFGIGIGSSGGDSDATLSDESSPATSNDGTDAADSTEGGEDAVAARPEDVLRDFKEADAAGECTRALDLLTANALEVGYGTRDQDEAMDQCEAFVAHGRSSGIQRHRMIHSIDVDSEAEGRALVVVAVTDVVADSGGGEWSETYRQEFTLTDENGWKIEIVGPRHYIDPAEVT